MLGDFWRRETEWSQPGLFSRSCGFVANELGLPTHWGEEALGRHGSVRPHFPFSHFQESELACTTAQYDGGPVPGTSVPRTGTA